MKLNTVIKNFSIRYDGRVLQKNSGGVYWCETTRNIWKWGWYSKLYWYFINATTADNNNDDNTTASTVIATATNKSNNYK